jgi:acyl-CoA thioester hydrolase
VQTPVAVRWSDEDGFGHVNNAAFLTYAEEGRDRMLTAVLGEDTVWDLVVVRVEIDYRAEVTHRDELVLLDTAVTGVGRSSVRTAEVVRKRDGSVAAELSSVSVARDRGTGRSRPWTDAERAALSAGLAAARLGPEH